MKPSEQLLKSQRFHYWRRFVSDALKVVLIASMTLICLLVLIKLMALKGVQDFATETNNLSTLALSILTFFLVVITGFYAWVTRKLLVGSEEDRKAAIRPNLWINLSRPEFTDTVVGTQAARSVAFTVHVSNYGRGHAVDAAFRFSVPHHQSSSPAVMDYVQKYLPNFPPFFGPSSSHQESITLLTATYKLSDYTQDFLELRVTYEDVDRNLYLMVNYYDLFPCLISLERTEYCFDVRREIIYFVPFSDRDPVRYSDDDSLYSQIEKSKIILERIHKIGP